MPSAVPEKFPCFRCGACCRNVSFVEPISSWAISDGSCRYFDSSTNSCTIYDNRPAVCNVWKTYRQDDDYRGISWDDFVYTNMLYCCALRYVSDIPEPEGSPFQGMQEEIAAVVLQDAAGVPPVSREDSIEQEIEHVEASGDDESLSDDKKELAPSASNAREEEADIREQGAAGQGDNSIYGDIDDAEDPLDNRASRPHETITKKRKIDALREEDHARSLVDAEVDLSVPDLSGLPSKAKEGTKGSAPAKRPTSSSPRSRFGRSRKATHERGELLD